MSGIPTSAGSRLRGARGIYTYIATFTVATVLIKEIRKCDNIASFSCLNFVRDTVWYTGRTEQVKVDRSHLSCKRLVVNVGML